MGTFGGFVLVIAVSVPGKLHGAVEPAGHSKFHDLVILVMATDVLVVGQFF